MTSSAAKRDEVRKEHIPEMIINPSNGKRYLKGRFLGKVSRISLFRQMFTVFSFKDMLCLIPNKLLFFLKNSDVWKFEFDYFLSVFGHALQKWPFKFGPTGFNV